MVKATDFKVGIQVLTDYMDMTPNIFSKRGMARVT